MAGPELQLQAGPWSATVAPHGASLRTLRHGDRDILWGYAGAAGKKGGQGDVLMPWPGRIAGGRYAFAGRAHQLERNDKSGPNAIHGFVRARTWDIESSGAAHATFGMALQPQEHPGYPFRLDLQVSYRLSPDGLTVLAGAENVGETPAPFGAGFHPYLLPQGPLSEARLTLQAQRMLERGADLVPTGESLEVPDGLAFHAGPAIGPVRLDDTFTALARDADGRARVRLDDVQLWMDAGFDHVQVFTGDTLGDDARKAVAVEPMTCGPDAFNQPHLGLRVLRPGDRWLGSWGIALGPMPPSRSGAR